MMPLAKGRIVLWEGGSLWIMRVPGGPGVKLRTDFHSHHALQVTLALDARFQLYGEDRSISGPAVLVGADASHAFEPVGVIALLFVEPESSAGRTLSATLLGDEPFASIPETILGNFPAQVAAAFRSLAKDDERLRQIGRGFVERLGGVDRLASLDDRVQTTIDWAIANLDRSLSISEAASNAGLSVGRMSHLFVEQTGLPFRTYLLWLRLTKAVEVYAAGRSLTEAAHEAGFADSAHFSRTFRRMFGVAAAELRLS
jgi:AraC family transcriptional regulator